MTFGISATTATLYLAAAAAAVSAYSAYSTSKTSKAIANHNADVAEIGAKDALQRGEQNAIDARRKGLLIQGQQRNMLAARGLDLQDGTPSDLLASSDFFTESDEATARTNGRKEWWAKEAQVQNFDLEANGQNPGLTLAGSLLSSGSSVASRWYQPRTTSGG